MPSSQPENQLDSDLDNILANLAWNGKYFDSGQEVVNAGEVIKAKEAIDRLVTEARIDELQGSLVALTSHAKPIRENAIEHMENRIAELQSQLTNKEEK